MSKCYFSVIVLWCCLVGFRSSWGLNSSRHLRSCDTTTLGSPTIPSSSIGLSTSLSIGDFGLTTFNVNDGVYCLSSGNCVRGESKASPNVDINVLTKTLILKIKHIFLSKSYNTFYIKSLQVSIRSSKHELIHERLLSFIDFYLHFFIWLNICHFLFLYCP